MGVLHGVAGVARVARVGGGGDQRARSGHYYTVVVLTLRPSRTRLQDCAVKARELATACGLLG